MRCRHHRCPFSASVAGATPASHRGRRRAAQMPGSDPTAPCYLIVTDHDHGVLSVEGPMTDDRPWESVALYARNHQHRITCGPAGPDRDALAAEYRRRTTWLAFHRAAS